MSSARASAARTFYTLYEGWAVRYHRLSDDSRQILDVILPGEQVGFTPVLLGRSAHSVQTLTPATFCVLDGRALPGALKANPELALELLRTWLAEARRSDLRLTMLGRLSAAERVGYFLIETMTGCAGAAWRSEGPLRSRCGGSTSRTRWGFPGCMSCARSRSCGASLLLDLEGGDLVIPDFAKLAKFTGYVPIPRAGKRAF